MPRTSTDIAHTDAEAARIGYVDPPAEMIPVPVDGQLDVYSDWPTWNDLVDWFAEHTSSYDTAILILLSRFNDWPTGDAYIHTDTFMKSQARRIDERDDPDAWMSYGN